MEILWLWGNTIFLSFVLLAPPSHSNSSLLRDGHYEMQIKCRMGFFKEIPIPKAWGIPGAAMTRWMRSFLPFLGAFPNSFWKPSRGNLIQQEIREDQNLRFREDQSGGSGCSSLNLCHTWARHVLLHLQGYFIRVTEQSWRFFLLMPFLVTMELCWEFRAAHPRQAPRSIITGKTLQGLFRKIIQPTQNANLKFLASGVAWIWSDCLWVGKRGRKLVVSWVHLKLGTHVHARLNIKHSAAF